MRRGLRRRSAETAAAAAERSLEEMRTRLCKLDEETQLRRLLEDPRSSGNPSLFRSANLSAADLRDQTRVCEQQERILVMGWRATASPLACRVYLVVCGARGEILFSI